MFKSEEEIFYPERMNANTNLNVTEFLEKIPGVEFAPVSDAQAVQMLMKSVLVAHSRNAFKMEEIVAMYPSLLVLRRLLKAQMEQQSQAPAPAAAAAAPRTQAGESGSDNGKAVTLAPTVKTATTTPAANANRVV